MKPEKLVAALDQCVAMLTRARSGFVVTYAGLFASHVRQNRVVLHQVPLRDLIGHTSTVTPQCAPLDIKGLNRGKIVRHIEFILAGEVTDSTKNLPKRARWVGFAAGAAAAIGLTPAYMVSDQRTAIILPYALFVAKDPAAPDHLLAHFMLGYMQGWLWADGQGSIDDFRRMNMPDDKPFKIEVIS